MFTAFWAMTCLQPPVTMPVSSRLGIVLEAALAAFRRVVPHVPSSPSYEYISSLRIHGQHLHITEITQLLLTVPNVYPSVSKCWSTSVR